MFVYNRQFQQQLLGSPRSVITIIIIVFHIRVETDVESAGGPVSQRPQPCLRGNSAWAINAVHA